MKLSILAFAALPFAILSGCDDGSSSTTSGPTNSGNGRIEAALVGTWVENPWRYSTPDTLIFTATRYRTQYLSGVGTQFTAKDGLVKGGPDNTTVGEYLRVDDTLYFDGLLGQAPNGVDPSTARRYEKSKL